MDEVERKVLFRSNVQSDVIKYESVIFIFYSYFKEFNEYTYQNFCVAGKYLENTKTDYSDNFLFKYITVNTYIYEVQRKTSKFKEIICKR